MDRLPVHFERRLVGTIEISAEGPVFSYDPSWLGLQGAFPISVLMPLAEARVAPRIFLPWAANLLPESEQLLSVGHFLGMAPTDVMGILSRIGRDTAGALSFGTPGNTSTAGWRPVESNDALERIINELPNKPFLLSEDGVSMSLAGAQTKLGVAIDDAGRLCIPADGSPSTHILKPDALKHMWGSVQNEAYCLTLARLIGLPTAKVTTGRAGSRSYLLVERYDRIKGSEGRWRRRHQEDYCQALGRLPGAKYESNSTGAAGPSSAEMFALTRDHMPIADVLQLLDAVVFNVIAGNTDAHAKNFSLTLSANGARLAPAYDLMNADVWENVSKNLAQKIAGKNRGEHLRGRHWQRFAKDCGLNPAQVLKRVESLCEAVLAKASEAERIVEAMPAGGHPLLPAVRSAIEGHARALSRQLSEVEDTDDLDVEAPASALTR
jgi:serine/threonine-protein kinase HipA